MPSESLYLSAAIERVASNIDKFSTLMAFNGSITDMELKVMLNAYPTLYIIAERSLQVGNLRRAEKYYVLLKRIETEITKRYAACVSDLEQKLMSE